MSLYALIYIHEQNRRKRDRTNRVKFYLRRSLKTERNYHRLISDCDRQRFMLSRGILGRGALIAPSFYVVKFHPSAADLYGDHIG